jgi:hypothetical protein
MASRTEHTYAPGCVRVDRGDALRHDGSCAGLPRDGAA